MCGAAPGFPAMAAWTAHPSSTPTRTPCRHAVQYDTSLVHHVAPGWDRWFVMTSDFGSPDYYNWVASDEVRGGFCSPSRQGGTLGTVRALRTKAPPPAGAGVSGMSVLSLTGLLTLHVHSYRACCGATALTSRITAQVHSWGRKNGAPGGLWQRAGWWERVQWQLPPGSASAHAVPLHASASHLCFPASRHTCQ